MAAIDHLVFVSPDVDAGVAMIEERSGVHAPFGGAHLGRGTHNALAGFDDSTYLEIIGIDPGQPEPDGPRPFGLNKAMRPHLATFAIHPTGDETMEDVVTSLRGTGIDFAEPEPMSRRRLDGSVVRWHLALPVGGNGAVPFVIDWGPTPNPATALPRVGDLRTLVVVHPDPVVRQVVSELDRRIESRGGEPSVSAWVETALGEMELAGHP